MNDSLIKAEFYDGEDRDLYFEDSVFITFDHLAHNSNCKYNVLLLFESRAVIDAFPQLSPTSRLIHGDEEISNLVKTKYDLVLTWGEDIYNNFENAKKFFWSPISGDVKPNEKAHLIKKNKISFITSSKIYTPGHHLRQDVYAWLEEWSGKTFPHNNFEYFQHKSPPFLETKNDILDEYKFSIVIENACDRNYFTEKIMDAFSTKTIPIYYGCPNIGDYFNPDGILQFNSMEELYDILLFIKDGLYESKLDAVEENFNRSKKFISPMAAVEKEILKMISRKNARI